MTEPCRTCGHLFGQHKVWMPGQPRFHGWMTCPEVGCDCFNTFSVNGFEPDEIDRARWAVAYALMHRDDLELVVARSLLREAGEPDNAVTAVLDTLPEHVQTWWRTEPNNRNE